MELDFRKSIICVICVICGLTGNAKTVKDELKEQTASKLPVKLRISELQVNPQTTFILPDGSIRMNVEVLNRGGISLAATSKYNFVNSDIDYRIKYSYVFGRNNIGLSVFDSIDFEKVFSDSRFIARKRGGEGGYWRRLGRFYSIGMTLSSEQHFMVPLVEETVDYDKSTLNSGTTRLAYDSRDNGSDPRAGTMYWVSFKQATEELDGDYRYNKAEMGLRKYFGLRFFAAEDAEPKEKKKRKSKKKKKNKVAPGKNLIIALEGLYGAVPYKRRISAEREAVPYLDHYRLGGFRNLRGYAVDEFMGEDVVSQRVEVRLSYKATEPVGKIWGLYFDRIELVGSYDVGVIGENVYCRRGYLRQVARQGVAYGFRFKLNVKRKISMILYLMEGRALRQNRDGVFYLSYTIY